MNKPQFGIAASVGPEVKIYYENIFSQHQIGRVTDLLSAIAAGSGIPIASFRYALSVAVTEACQNQGMFEGAQSPRDPVAIEFAADGEKALASVGFTFDPAYSDVISEFSDHEFPKDSMESPSLVKSLYIIAKFTAEVTLKLDIFSKYAEFSISFPLKANRLRAPAPIECVFVSRDSSTVSPDREYVELGDVAYTELLENRRSNARKLIEAATSPEERISAQAVLAEAETRLSAEDSRQEAQQVAKGGPQQETNVESTVVRGDSPAPQANAVLVSGSNADNNAGNLLSLLQEAKALAQNEPLLAVAALRKAHTPETMERLLSSSNLANEETAKAVIDNLTPEELAKAIVSAMPLKKVGEIVVSRMSEDDLMEAISAGLPRDELAKAITSALPKDRYSEIITDGLPPREIAKALAEGLPKLQFAKLVSTVVPEPKIAEALSLAEGDDDTQESKQALLTKDQVEILMKPETTRNESISILCQVMSRSAAESIFTGTIPKSEVTVELENFLPDSQVATQVASRLMDYQILDTAAMPNHQLEKKLDDSSKAVEFYITRTRELETRLRAAEDQRQLAEQDARLLKSRLAEIELQKAATGKTEAEPQTAAPSKTSIAPSLIRERETARLFQKRCREFEVDLGEAQAEIRRLQAGHVRPKMANFKSPDVAARPEQAPADASAIAAPPSEVPPISPDTSQALPGESAEASPAALRDDLTVEEVQRELDEETRKLDKNLNGFISNIEELKAELPEEKAKKHVDGMLREVFHEKARINELSRELAAAFRKKEFAFKTRETALTEELRQARHQVNQRNANVERMKELMAAMQQRIRADKETSGESAASEVQMRVKNEHNQRQIEALKEEIERLNRRAQSAPSTQQNAAQQRELTRAQKNAVVAEKALAAKKQELELLKRQMVEKDAREAEYKRSIIRLQNELTAVKAAPKKTVA
ncbi:MAG: hypothetical protein P4M08_10480 [Oligoflexia bacterium]|nr:hypothetical protein [Oligoflexia bacterium]